MKVHIVTNTQKDKDRSVTEAIVRELLDLGVEVSSDVPSVADAFQSVNFRETAEGIETCDIVLSVGGDGTILRAAKKASEEEKPILGVNMGKVGFLAEVEPVEVTLLNRLIDGKYTVDERMMLDCKVVRNGKVCFSCSALNDVVISHGAVSRTVGIKVDSDVGFISEYSADGIVFSTPTGSTGYSISAGGPVVDPCMRLYVATPICAHMLSVRSAVLSSNKDIRIKLDGEYGNADAVVTADGDIQGYIKNADEVIITESEYDFELIKIGEQSFYDTLIKKLS